MNKGDVLYSIDNIQDRINVYFRFNKVTKEKIDFMKNHLNNNINLMFHKKLNYFYILVLWFALL